MERYYKDGTIPWVKSGELNEEIIKDTEEQLTQAAIEETNIKLIPAGALLIAMYGATVGRMGILGMTATTNQAVCHIIPNPDIAYVRYVFHFLRSIVPHLLTKRVGGAQPNISQGIIKELKVPLPSLAEQRRIADALDRAEALRAKRREALAELDRLGQSIFFELFGDPAINQKKFPHIELGEIVKVISGYAFKSDDFSTEGKAIVRISNLQGEDIDLSSVVRIPEPKLDRGRNFKIYPGDILIAMSGATTGKLGLVPLNIGEELYQNQRVGNYRITNPEKIQKEFLLGLLRSDFYHRFLWQLAWGAAQPNVSAGQLESAVVPLPPLPLQQEFAHRISISKTLKSTYRASLSELDALFASLQHRAFRGELFHEQRRNEQQLRLPEI